ncbi:hypothetical protein Rxycam_02194 [Rubrobacter xylanophilus DSM 9941]|uniref:choice-of-anchor P family protein n=1 Tax=Rubrobacter xylanophilus TaxID=49319 RepID=UPI001C643C91|nr:choice-of-anchor P family protein [Rubrobacter xylanophilus]QYJ16361.1 hypothetical protein Rxycam_02194 [Rubrobacter xylanophilus DSM 9941]
MGGHASGRLKRLLTLWFGLLFGVALVTLVAGAGRGEAASQLKGSFRGNAYGTYANAQAGPVAATLGRSAFIPCPCNGTGGKTRSNSVDSLDAGRVLKAGVLRSTVFTRKTSTSAQVRNTSTVSGLNLLDGLITADAVRAVANTNADARRITVSAAGSSFVDLRVNGRRVADVSPNTRIDLPGLGYVVLKSVVPGGNGKSLRTVRVEMITVVITRENDFGLPVGARIVVAHAYSGFSRNQPEVIVGGQAYAATANARIGDTLQNNIGKAAFVVMGCEGTGGKVRTNNIAALSVGDVLSIGSGRTTAFGGRRDSGTVARTTATVQDLSLLGGLITADAVKAVAQDTFRNGRRISSTQGTEFARLRVAGIPLPINVRPNTRLDLPGLGYVVVNEQQIPAAGSDARTQVNGLRVVVTQDNLLGLPVGAQITVAHASSRVARF